MVGVLLALRFRVLANTLRRNTGQLVAVVIESLQSFGLICVVVGGLFVASTAPAVATQNVVVLGGATLMLGWVFVPLLFSGVEQTLDPLMLARFPLRTGQLMGAMMLVGVTWIPGVTTIIASVATVIAWRHFPAAAVLAVICGCIGASTCIAGSRLTTSVVGALIRGHGAGRNLTAAVALVVVGGPVGAALMGAMAAGGTLLAKFTAATAVLAWTPIGAVWSIPGRVALGDASGAVGAAAVAVATVVGVFLLWRLTLGRSLIVRGSGAGRTGRSRLGVLRFGRSGPTAAIAARSLIYWFRDARLSRQLVLIPLLPALVLLLWSLVQVDGFAIAAGPLAATLLPLSVFAGLSYDGTAFAAEVAAGVRGVHDRLGRAIALLVVAGPAVVVVQSLIAVLIGRTGDLPALLGLSLGTLLVATGVVSVSSARLVVPVARSRRNPFSDPAGAATTSVLASYLVMAVTVVLSLPFAAVTIAALVTGSTVMGWLGFALGILVGIVVVLSGVVLGGRWLDSSAPAVLARLRRIRA